MLDPFSLSAFLTSRDGAGLLRRFNRVKLGKGAPVVGDPLDAGDIFSLHSGCDLTTAAPSELRVISRDAFCALLTDNPMLALGMMAVLGRVLAAMTRTVESLVFDDVRQRLAVAFMQDLLDRPWYRRATTDIAAQATLTR